MGTLNEGDLFPPDLKCEHDNIEQADHNEKEGKPVESVRRFLLAFGKQHLKALFRVAPSLRIAEASAILKHVE
ncbi:MAG: hypothetical protein ACLPID_18160 [Beijerinckiaceae bacterium]